MKKEGIGKPQYLDIALDADVKITELYFEEVPEQEVDFRGSTSRNPVGESGGANLPDRVQEGVVYRDAEVRLRIATEVVQDNSGLLSNPNKERVRDKLRTTEVQGSRRETESEEEIE